VLDALLEQERPKARPEPAKKRRDAKAGRDGDEVNEDAPHPIDEAWPLWPVVRGRSVVMVGGDPREPNRLRLERAFQLRSLEWPDISGPRKVDAVTARVRRRSMDIIVLLKGLVDHKQSEPIIAAAKESSVAWTLAEGYDVTSVKASLDRFLGARRE
jgi:hypothetical protein